MGTPVSSTNKTDRHDIAELLLKVALNTITPFSDIFMTNLCLPTYNRVGVKVELKFAGNLY